MALKCFFEKVYNTYCSLHSESYIVDQIHQAVEEVVQIIANSIGEDNDLLEISDIISVGSCAEGTKICSPNEFDFMVCLNRLSNPSAIDIKPGCRDGFKIVFIKDKTLNDFGIKLYGDCWCLCKDEIKHLFIDSLERVVAKLRNHYLFKANGQMVIESSTYLTVRLIWIQFSSTFLLSTQYCKMKGTEQSKGLFPCEIKESDSSYGWLQEIDVDFMPSFMINDEKLVTDLEYFPANFKELVQERGCHIVLKACDMEPTPLCMQISFAFSEVFLMKNLHQVHMQCYKILKYLLIKDTNLNKPLKCLNLSSYTLKMAMLHHQYEGLCDQPLELEKCIFSVIEYLSYGFRKGEMLTFFMRNLNVWGATYKVPIFDHWLPEGIDENKCCRAFCSQILWLEFWRQVLKRAQNIFKEIQTLDVSDLFKTVDDNPGQVMEKDNNPGHSVEKNNKPCHSMNKDNNPCQSMNKDNYPGHSMEKNNKPGQTMNKDTNPGQSMNKDKTPSRSMEKNNKPGQNINKDNTPSSCMSNDNNPGHNMENDCNRSHSIEKDNNRSRSIENDKHPCHSIEKDNTPSVSMEKNHNPSHSMKNDNKPGDSMEKDNNTSRSMENNYNPCHSMNNDNNPCHSMNKDNKPCQSMNKNNNPGHNLEKDNKSCHSMEKECVYKVNDITGIEMNTNGANSSTNIALYINTKFDIYLSEFQELKRFIVTVCKDFIRTYYGPRTEKLSIPPPKEEMLELVLPKFDEYLMKILSICKITNCLTTDNPDDFQDSENVAVLHRRQSSNSEIPNCLTIDNPDDLHDSENVAVLHRRQNSNSEIPNCLTIENPDDLQDSENVAVLHRRQSSNSEIPNCLTTDNPDDLQDSENVAVLHRRQSSNSEIPNCLNTDNSEDNSEVS